MTALSMPQRLLITGAFHSSAECLQRTERALMQKNIRAVICARPASCGADLVCWPKKAMATLPYASQGAAECRC
ncbi:MAG: hypothetical protein R3E67_01050 [Pseudomonadales bacterium]